MKMIACALGVTMLAASCQDSNYIADASSLCRCDERGIDNPCDGALDGWLNVVNNQMEVAAFDFKRGGYIGTECEGETGVAWDWPPFYFNSWRPVNGYKQTLVGVLNDFNWNYDDDEDWNIHIVPDQPFMYLINDVEALHSESSDEHNRCGNKCMEGEISPDKTFWQNPFFFEPGKHQDDADNNGYSILEGKRIGMYGGWIMDANHDFKSEIHSSNMIWWKDHWDRGFGSSGPFDIFWLMLLQDNTGRFDDRDNFDCDGDTPSGWQPWEQSPVSGQFRIAFLADPNGPIVQFEINEIARRFVVTENDADASKDIDDGKVHGLEYQGKLLVTVKENQTNDDDLGVSFTGLCLRPDGKVQGYLSIKGLVGADDDKDEEGYFFMYVVRSQQARFPRFRLPEVAPLSDRIKKQQKRDTTTSLGLKTFLYDSIDAFYPILAKDSFWKGNLQPAGIRSIQVRVLPSYIRLKKNGEPMDNSTPALQKPNSSLDIKWEVKAKDFHTGKPVDVVVSYHSGLHKNDSISLKFPETYDNRLVECSVAAYIKDKNGQSTLTERKYWNQCIQTEKNKLNDIATLLSEPSMQQYNYLWDRKFKAVKPTAENYRVQDKKWRKALAFQNHLRQLSRDRMITIGEYQQLKTAVLHLGRE